MNNLSNKNILELLAIFFLSISLFVYEMLITRLFSTILFYHFVFLTISLAILGLCFGGLIIYKTRKKYSLEKLALTLAFSFFISIIIIYKLPYMKIYLIYSLITSIPFVIGGMILSLVFLKYSSISNKLYFADLLGSTLGSVIIIPLMDNLSFMRTLFVIIIFSILSGVLFSIKFGTKKMKYILISFLILTSTLLIQKNFLLELEKNFTSYLTSPITVIEHIRQNSNEEVNIVFSSWDSISRTDVIENNDREKIIITDGGASAPMIRFNGNLDDVSYLKEEINYLPFTIGNNEDTLLIGSGGGKDVLLAILGGSKNIDAVEINSSVVDTVNAYKDFNGDIYNYEGVNLFVEDGRSFIEKTNKKYNNIYLSMVMSKAVGYGGLSLTENFLYTKEAFKTYFDHLKDNGYLSFMFHSTFDMVRGINTGIETLLDAGVNQKDILKHFIVINNITNTMAEKYGNRISMPIVIFKKKPFTTEEIENIYNAAVKQDRIIINMPGIKYMDLYNKLVLGKSTLEEMYDKLYFNAKPTTDNKPFFYDFKKGIPNILQTLIILISIIIVLLYRTSIRNIRNLRLLFYFSTIGIGFMLIEISLIQKSILFLGNPIRAFSYTIFSLLLSCGIGSYFSNKKIFKTTIKHRDIVFVFIPILIMFLLIALPIITKLYKDFKEIYKLIILTITLFPLGFFMGMAFPKGILRLKEKGQKEYIPLMLGVNGIMSVMGSVLSLIISMNFGFTITMLFGALMYLTIFIFKLLE
ncbi:hypothetical protein [Caloranaerobacter sp. DY30410]|uniref:hypothetical protein n=1 Tax=Caloranaerobacter sp. DY30410 TaxID=3238305 RepID=UPI003D0528CB